MDKADGIDASLGLDYCLPLFRRYQKSGLLQARVQHIPRLSGQYEATLSLIKGEVVETSLLDKWGARQALALDILLRVDRERGPFEWRFYEQPLAASPNRLASAQMSPAQPSPAFAPGGVELTSQISGHMIPVIVAPVDWDRLQGWTPQQKQLLYAIAALIDGKRTLAEIQLQTSLSSALVYEAMRILLSLRAVTFSSF